MKDAENEDRPADHAWRIGAAIETGVDGEEARRQLDAGQIIIPAAGAAAVGGAAATATGLGGVGLAFGGGAIGIGAVAAVGIPAVAAAAAGYGIYRGIRELGRWGRVQTLRGLVEHFQSVDGQFYVDRMFHVEGRGQVEADRLPPTPSSAKATLRIVGSSDSKGFMGLFCSPEGQFVLTYDIEPGHWAYVVVAQDDKFSGAGTDLRGQDLGIGELDSVRAVLRVLEREGFVALRKETDDDGC